MSETPEVAQVAKASKRRSALILVLSIAASWVGVAQLARAAEQETERRQGSSVVPLMTWANATAWMILAIPHLLKRMREENGGSLLTLLKTDAFTVWQPPQFLAIALSTNLCYIAALHFLPASLNTAIFCTSPVFTLLLSVIWLREGNGTWSWVLRQSLVVLMSVIGVILIAEPWKANASGDGGDGSRSTRLAGALLSLAAAAGTAIYQVRFKLTFGDSMPPEGVGLFLAHMGLLTSVVGGALGAWALSEGVYSLSLSEVPWGLIGWTAFSSALFNFLIKFGLSRDSPVSISLATQIGIPLNLLLDVFVVHSSIEAAQVAGAIVMLVSFTIQHGGCGCECSACLPQAFLREKKVPDSKVALLEGHDGSA